MVDTEATPGRAFAALIRDARLRLDLTQQQLAVRAGVSLSSVARWEGGDATAPMPAQIAAVCDVLGLRRTDALIALGYLTDADLAPAA